VDVKYQGELVGHNEFELELNCAVPTETPPPPTPTQTGTPPTPTQTGTPPTPTQTTPPTATGTQPPETPQPGPAPAPNTGVEDFPLPIIICCGALLLLVIGLPIFFVGSIIKKKLVVKN
jgi:hypothetical protein